MKVTVGVFFGGKSVEHEVSIISALQVINALKESGKYDVIPIYITKSNEFYFSDKLLDINTYKNIDELKKKCDSIYMVSKNSKVYIYKEGSTFKKELASIDIAFPVVHGLNVEDGTLQGFLEMYNIPYVGSDVCSSAVGMNKIIFKKVLRESGIPSIDYAEIYESDFEESEQKVINAVKEKLDFPMILKPANLGSSVGIKIVKNEEELLNGIRFVLEFTDKILVEKCITNLREINSSVLGNLEEIELSELEEPVKQDEFLSFKDKYMSEGGKGTKQSRQGMASLTRKIPADLSDGQRNIILELSKRVFRVLGCEGVVRIDYIIDEDTKEIYVNEINTIPGSISFYLWEPKGVGFQNLCDKLIHLAIKRHERREAKIYSNDVNLLSMHSKK